MKKFFIYITFLGYLLFLLKGSIIFCQMLPYGYSGYIPDPDSIILSYPTMELNPLCNSNTPG